MEKLLCPQPWRKCLDSTPITALCFSPDARFLLVGNGPQLEIYSTNAEWPLVRREIVFHDARIHGIAFGPMHSKHIVFVLYGQKTVQCRLWSDDAESELLHQAKGVVDWVTDACVLPSKGRKEAPSVEHTMLFCTAHNAITALEMGSFRQVAVHKCPDHSVSHQTRIRPNAVYGESVLAATVTCMREILLWDVLKSEIIHRLMGHEGVIFRVFWSPCSTFAVSASDDRTIRRWDIPIGNESSSRLVHTYFGHLARVWDCSIVGNYVVSSAEDSTCKVWHLQGRLLQTLQGHAGKNIWRIAATEEKAFLATGGGDGDVRVWSIDSHQTAERENSIHSIPVPFNVEDENSIPLQPETIRHVAVSKNRETFACSSNGSLYCISEDYKVKQIFHRPRYTYNGIVASPDSRFVLVSDAFGKLLLFDCARNYQELEWIAHKERALYIYFAGTCDIVSYGTDAVLCWWRLHRDQDQSVRIELVGSYHPLGARRAITSCVSSKYKDKDVLLCGDSNGGVIVYCATDSPHLDDIGSASAKLLNVHGAERVSAISCENSPTVTGWLEFVTAGHDGHIAHLYLDENMKLHVSKTHNMKQHVTHINCMVSRDSFWIGGFKSGAFVVWDVIRNSQVFAHECAGFRRPHDCDIDPITNGVHLSYFKDGRVHLATFKGTTQSFSCGFIKSLRQQSHGRETNATAFIDPDIYITAGEDAHMRIFKIVDPNEPAELVDVVEGHLCTVRAIKVIQNDDWHGFLSVGGKEHIMGWKVERGKIVPSQRPISHSLVAQHYNRRREHDDVRLMSIDAVPSLLQKGIYIAACGSSNSCIQMYGFHPTERRLDLLLSIKHRTSMVLCSRFCLLKLRGALLHVLFVGTSDGYGSFWSIKEGFGESYSVSCCKIFESRMHQRGLNACDIQESIASQSMDERSHASILLATCGDDQAVKCHQFSFSMDSDEALQVILESTASCPRAHSSDVRDIRWVVDRIISLGGDQRLCAWKFEDGFSELVHIGSCLVDVSDPNGIDWIMDSPLPRIVCTGIGQQRFVLG